LNAAHAEEYWEDIERMEAGEPVVVPTWYVGGHSFPEAPRRIPWLDYFSGYKAPLMRVFPDDRVEPIYEDE
jgi:hypothetical protein